MQKRSVVFRSNGGPQVGNGHIIRCLALAQELRLRGWLTFLAAPKLTFSTIPQARNFDQCIHLISDVDEAQRIADAIPKTVDLLVVDDYTLDIRLEEPCRAWARKILVLDDLANRHHDADLIVDSRPQSGTPYHSLAPKHCTVLLGPKWALLRPEFSIKREATLKRRQLGAPVQRILIAIGGADGRNLTPLLISAAIAATAEQSVHLDVILGGHAASLATVREMQRRRPHSFALHVDTDRVASLMSKADVAIGACGGGSWERCTMGLPTIGIITANNQKSVAASLSEAGAIELIGEWPEVTEARIETAITSLLDDPRRRQDISAASSVLCDGKGAFRLSAVLDRIEVKRGLHD